MKKYNFYGNEIAMNVHSINKDFKGIDTAIDLYDKLSNIWCANTCAPRMRDNWTKENMTMGQCSITAFLAQDIFGGEVYATITENGNLHCFNKVGEYIFDLTSEQFEEKAKDLVYDLKLPQERESKDHFFKEEKRQRYEYLKEQLLKEKESMRIEHIAMYVNDIEATRDFFVKYFAAVSDNGYYNKSKGFRSYFLTFDDGARLELMNKTDMVDSKKDITRTGFIHMAISVGSKEKVDSITSMLKNDGYKVLSGPRTTGDGYYESCILDMEGNQIEITV